ncbi:MAG: 2-C-methyl-D-erythritol 4-phosphate cytidylyltransferase [Dehalococcoidia bacterium]|nr:2-C-methyl-D-erythritol 4-phosphate cytidylyltransferase [Dehalococcoidia bacterium]
MTAPQRVDRSARHTSLILAGAGESLRMDGIDKVFAPLGGHPLIYWPLRAAQDCNLIDQILIVLSAKNIERGRSLVREYGFAKVTEVYEGGTRRQDSVRVGLSKVSGCEWVLVQDAARPFLDYSLIERGLAAARETGAALAAVPVKDTVKVAGADMFISSTPDRAKLWAAQTPQVFLFDIIARAYDLDVEATDDAALVEQLGIKVRIYQGSYDNIKVTTPEDLARAELILKRR